MGLVPSNQGYGSFGIPLLFLHTKIPSLTSTNYFLIDEFENYRQVLHSMLYLSAEAQLLNSSRLVGNLAMDLFGKRGISTDSCNGFLGDTTPSIPSLKLIVRTSKLMLGRQPFPFGKTSQVRTVFFSGRITLWINFDHNAPKPKCSRLFFGSSETRLVISPPTFTPLKINIEHYHGRFGRSFSFPNG